jgi:hypothetical protein
MITIQVLLLLYRCCYPASRSSPHRGVELRREPRLLLPVPRLHHPPRVELAARVARGVAAQVERESKALRVQG